MSEGKELQKIGGQALLVAETLENVHKFQTTLNGVPNPAEIKKNAAARDAKYIPIGEVEKLLDEMFAGLWQTHSFEWKVVANELVGSIVLEYFHPVVHVWMKRTGVGAVPVTMTSGSKVPEMLEKKIVNACVTVAPHLKAECVKNAARSIGQRFGRDLNRSTEYGDYESLSDMMIPFERMAEIETYLENCHTKDDVTECYRSMLSATEKRDLEIRNLFTKRRSEL